LFGKTLGEGSYARVVHAKLKRDESAQYAIKIMEKEHIKKEGKVSGDIFHLHQLFDRPNIFHSNVQIQNVMMEKKVAVATSSSGLPHVPARYGSQPHS
jgi:serine/threonine protein kinase